MLFRSNPYPYESLNFSDYIESKVQDIGRINVINKDAQQIWKPSLTRWSLAYSVGTRLNGLSTFNEENSKFYYRQYGVIFKLYGLQTILFVIQEDNWFKSLINKNLLTQGDGNTLIALTSELLSDPVEGSSNIIQGDGIYGCSKIGRAHV